MIDRIITNLRAIIRSEFPSLAFLGTYEYVIQTTGETIGADPVDTTLGLPSIANVRMCAGLLGETVKPTVGKICYVIFLNGDRTKARVIGAEGDADEISVPATTSIKLAGGVLGVARMTDPVLAGGIFAGTITSASTKVKAG